MGVIDNIGNVYGITNVEILGPDGRPKTTGGGGGGSPTGPAGGDLTGTYPNPGVNWSLGSPVYDLLYYPLSTNPAGYLTSASLSSYLTIASAALTYYPLTNPSGYISGITGVMVTTALGYTPYNATNPAGYISGITSGDVTTALGFTPYSNTNPFGFITSAALTGYLTSATAALTYYPIPTGTTSQYIRGDGSLATFPTSLVTGSGTATRVAFWDTVSSLSSNSDLYWDNVNNRLGIGNTSPIAPIDLGSSTGSAGTINKLALYSSIYGTYGFGISPAQLDYVSGGAHVFYKNNPSITELFRIDNSGNLTSVSLIGSGTRMLITDALGVISSQVIPTIPTVTPSTLTKTDDTNVTLTLGGTPSTALLQAVSLTLGWTGTLADSRITSASTWNAKEPAIAAGTTAQYWRGDKTWQAFPTIPSVTPSGLTKTDDTNVTLTLGGTPASALLQAVSLTLGWSGTLADSRIASAATWNAKQNALGFTPVPDSRTLTINGTTYDLTANRSWTISTASNLEIKDEGTTLTSAATSINFTGSEVVASAVGSAVTVNVARTLSPAENLFNYYNFI